MFLLNNRGHAHVASVVAKLGPSVESRSWAQYHNSP